MRKFQEFLESKSLKLQEMHEPGHYDIDDDPDSDDYNLGMQQTGEEREDKQRDHHPWDWLIDKSKSYQDALNRIRDLTRAYGKGGKWTIEPERLIPKIAELIDEVLPERPQYNFRSRK